MELTTVIQCVARVAATYHESGEQSVKVFAEAEYAPGRTTTAEVAMSEIPAALVERLAVVQREILAAVAPQLGQRMSQSIHKSAEVAAAHGEI